MRQGASNTLGRRARWAVQVHRTLGGPPLMPERLRRWVLVVSMMAAACLSGFGFDARNSSRPVLFDRIVDAFFVRASGLDHRVAVILSEFGDPKVFVTVTAVAAVVLVLVGDYRAAVATLGAVALGLVLVEEVLKPFFGRHLPGLAGPTFPSGHTTVAVALASAVILAARRGRPLGALLGLALRCLLMAIAVVVSCAVGLAMVTLRLHYMSDVVSGVPLGLAVTGCTAMFVDAVARRWVSPDDRAARSASLGLRHNSADHGLGFPTGG